MIDLIGRKVSKLQFKLHREHTTHTVYLVHGTSKGEEKEEEDTRIIAKK